MQRFFQQTRDMLADAVEEEIFGSVLELSFAGALASASASYGPPIPMVIDSLPVTGPTGAGSYPQNPTGGLKGDRN